MFLDGSGKSVVRWKWKAQSSFSSETETGEADPQPGDGAVELDNTGWPVNMCDWLSTHSFSQLPARNEDGYVEQKHY